MLLANPWAPRIRGAKHLGWTLAVCVLLSLGAAPCHAGSFWDYVPIVGTIKKASERAKQTREKYDNLLGEASDSNSNPGDDLDNINKERAKEMGRSASEIAEEGGKQFEKVPGIGTGIKTARRGSSFLNWLFGKDKKPQSVDPCLNEGGGSEAGSDAGRDAATEGGKTAAQSSAQGAAQAAAQSAARPPVGGGGGGSGAPPVGGGGGGCGGPCGR
jgi:hypothetical protein